MAEYVVVSRAGKSMTVEGEHLQWSVKEGSNAALIFVSAANNETVAVFPADAVAAVYLKDAQKPMGASRPPNVKLDAF